MGLNEIAAEASRLVRSKYRGQESTQDPNQKMSFEENTFKVLMSDEKIYGGCLTVVCISDFCNRYNITKEVRLSLGVYNKGVQCISKGRFENLAQEMRRNGDKRAREEEVNVKSKKWCIHHDAESLEGDTLESRHDFDASKTILMSSDIHGRDLEITYVLGQDGHNEILVSDDTQLPFEQGNDDARLTSEGFNMLSSTGVQILPLPPRRTFNSLALEPSILDSEGFCERNSSPPPFHA